MRKVLEIISHTDFIWTSNVLDYVALKQNILPVKTWRCCLDG